MSARQPDDRVIVGRLGTAHGIKGWLKVTSFTEPRDNLFAYSPWQLQLNNDWHERSPIDARVQGKGFVVQLEDIEDRTAALTLRGADIAVFRHQLPALEEDEVYWTDLVGLAVTTTEGVSLGHITEMMATGANDVMVVNDNTRQRLVPFIREQVVKKIDLDAATMVVDWDPEF